MLKKNLIEGLPFDIVQQVSSFLDYKSIVVASKACKTWHGLFNNDSIWKDQLKKDFCIENNQIFPFEKTIKMPNYKQLYVRFHYLSQQRNLPEFIKNIYRDKTQHHLVLLACADNDTYLKNIPREQQYIIAVLSIYAGCSNIPYSFLEKHLDKNLSENFLDHAAMSGYLQLLQYLLKDKNKFGLKPNNFTLKCTACSGNLKLVQYLLNPDNKFGLNSDNETLRLAAQSGNLKLVKYLLNVNYKNGLTPDKVTLDRAACSGNLQLVQDLLNPKNRFGLTADREVLKYAAVSGNLQLVHYLLNPDNKFGLTPDRDALSGAALSGNLQLVQYLLNPDNKFELTPHKHTLNCAAASGNLQLVQYLLNPKNKFELTPDKNSLDAAIYGNLQLVQYLLNQFHLIPDDETLNRAATSGNLQLVQYLLDPANQFGLEVNTVLLDSTTKTKNFALSEYFLPSHLALQDALKKLQAHDITAAKTLLRQSHVACPSHYKMMLQYILNHTQCFNLSEDSIQCLHEIANNSLLEGSEIEMLKKRNHCILI